MTKAPPSFDHVRVQSVAAADNAAAVITLAADPDEAWVIDSVTPSFLTAPSSEPTLTITDGTQSWIVSINDAGSKHFPFTSPMRFKKGDAVTITLAAGGAGVKGGLAVQYR